MKLQGSVTGSVTSRVQPGDSEVIQCVALVSSYQLRTSENLQDTAAVITLRELHYTAPISYMGITWVYYPTKQGSTSSGGGGGR